MSPIGPPSWSQVYSECGGNRQSPINIETANLIKVKYPCDVQISNTEAKVTRVKFDLKDYSMGIDLFFDNDGPPILSGGPFGNDNFYRFLNYHYHWGLIDNEGSEHRINGKSYALERHFIFINLKYNSLNEALTQSDGLVVVGKLYTVDDSADPLDLVDFFPVFYEEVVNSTTFQPPTPLSFRSVFGSNPFIYAHYLGSLTTPPCSEVVSWFVSLKINKISSKQIQVFRDLIDKNQLVAANNFRLPQPMNRRTVMLGKAKVYGKSVICSTEPQEVFNRFTGPINPINNIVRRNLQITDERVPMSPLIS